MNRKQRFFGAGIFGLLAIGAMTSCDRAPIVRNCNPDASVQCPQLNDPGGRIEGTLIYQGPLPPAGADGRATGRVVLLLFEYDNPPPPQGSATTAVSFQTVSAAQLFENATLLPDGVSVRATTPYSFPGILRPGSYMIRAFYSRTEEISCGDNQRCPSGFHPLFGVRNLPTKDDVGGGALVDSSAAVPQFLRIPIGIAGPPDANNRPTYTLPEEGYVAENITVFLGSRFPLERPMFNVLTEGGSPVGPMGPQMVPPPTPSTRMRRKTVPALADPPEDTLYVDRPVPIDSATGMPVPGPELLDYATRWGLQPPGTPVLDMPRNIVVRDTSGGTDLPTFTIAPSFPSTECSIAAFAGVRCADNPFRDIGFLEAAADINENGRIDLTAETGFADVHPTLITANPLAARTMGRLPWLYPLVLVSKLHEPNIVERALLLCGLNGRLNPDAQTCARRGPMTPELLARLRTALNRSEALDLSDRGDPRYPVLMFGSVIPDGTAASFITIPWDRGTRRTEAFPRIGIIPIGIEVHGPSRARDWVPIITPTLPETATRLETSLRAFSSFRCVPFDPEIIDDDQTTGLPTGRYGINLIGPGGQAWSLPNDLSGFPRPTAANDSSCPNGVCSMPSQGFFFRLRGLEVPPAGVRCPVVMR